MDWVPGLSQLKSTVQLLTGDVEGAAQTQVNFLRQCPVVSQGTSLGQLIAGDVDGALETQKQCIGTVNNVANGIPVVGHLKGAIHHAVGDHEGGNRALLSSTRSATVLAAGAVAGITTGGLAAIPAGIAAAGTFDGIHTIAAEQERGVFASIARVEKDPNAGNIFDLCAGVAMDGVSGYSGGQLGIKLANKVHVAQMKAANRAEIGRLEALRDAKADILMDNMDGKGDLNSGQAYALGQEMKTIQHKIDSLSGNQPAYFDPKAPTQSTSTVAPGINPDNPDDPDNRKRSKSKTTPCPNPTRNPTRNPTHTPIPPTTRTRQPRQLTESLTEQDIVILQKLLAKERQIFFKDLSGGRESYPSVQEQRNHLDRLHQEGRQNAKPINVEYADISMSDDSGANEPQDDPPSQDENQDSESEEEEESSSSDEESEEESESEDESTDLAYEDDMTSSEQEELTSAELQQLKNNPVLQKVVDALRRHHLRLVPLFEENDFDGALFMNNLYAGSLHILLRHLNHFKRLIPKLRLKLRHIKDRYPSLYKLLRKIYTTSTSQFKKKWADGLIRLLSGFTQTELNDVLKFLQNGQDLIYQFLRKALRSRRFYQCNGVLVQQRGGGSEALRERIYLRIPIRSRRDANIECHVYMVIGVSTEWYTPFPGQRRPFRNIISVYLLDDITEQEWNRLANTGWDPANPTNP